MKNLLLSIILFMSSIAHGNEDDLDILHIQLNVDENNGIMIVSWAGDVPLSAYENKWLAYPARDPDTGAAVSIEIWIATWYGVCKRPCEMEVDFVTRNVNYITK